MKGKLGSANETGLDTGNLYRGTVLTEARGGAGCKREANIQSNLERKMNFHGEGLGCNGLVPPFISSVGLLRVICFRGLSFGGGLSRNNSTKKVKL